MDDKCKHNDDMKRVGVFGTGKMAMHHIKAINMQNKSKVVAIADPFADRKKLQINLQEDIPIYSHPQELLNSIHPDIVHICTPPSTHAALATLALKGGSHIYVEKPFSLYSHEAEEVISLANSLKLKLCSGHQLLFEPHMLNVKEQLKKLGRIVHVESYFSFKPVRRSNDGLASISPLDQLIDILPHPVYLLQCFLKINNPGSIPVEICDLHIRTDGNVSGILSCGDTTGILIVTLTGRPIESYVRVVGTNGSLFAEFVRGTLVTNPGPGTSGISKIIYPYSQAWQIIMETSFALFKRAMRKQKSYPGLFEIIRAFYKSLEPGEEVVFDGSSIIETVSICEKIGKKLKLMEEDENRFAEAELSRIELEIPRPEADRGEVLVTGGTGMLGHAVARELRKNKWKVKIISRRNQPFSMRIPGVEYLKADLGKSITDELLQDISIVVHCAAETSGGKEAHELNSIGATRNLLHAMATTGVKKLIHISSLAVLKTSRETGVAIDENTALTLEPEARGPYVWGKAESERLVIELGKSIGIDVRIIRPGPLVDYDAFVAPGRLGREVGPYYIYIGSNRDKLSLCKVQTAAEVIKLYVEKYDIMPPILNLIEPIPPTRGELVSLLLKNRPDLSTIRIPATLFWVISLFAKLLQRVVRPGRMPVDIYAAFSSEKYKSDLAGKIIEMTK